MIRIDKNQIQIDDYQLISDVDENKIVVVYKTYKVLIEGNDLQIMVFTTNEMTISGKILKVTYEYD